eukprot:CAMPEP_0196804586 /NCGR_PEP_ID=MMETSP1362-20130617/4222_1 /TAXON_ID=163516 /ORGANISM="Leptocylindrus danicus, Strain CCMP1856" /LENGTH=32 /DNA_ID= /DNA_START= /DNA_END= /DNA_ORIENTATION=
MPEREKKSPLGISMSCLFDRRAAQNAAMQQQQ